MSGENVAQALKQNWWWLLIIGIVYVIAGFVAVGHPVMSTYAVELVIGVVLIVGGIISVIGSFFMGDWKRFLLILVSGILYIIVGYILLRHPLEGVLTLTLFLGAFLFVEGVFKIINALQMKPAPNWGWLLISGIASLILGILIYAEFPSSSTYIIGLLVGIYFLLNGFSMMMISFAVKGGDNSVAQG